MRPFAEALAAAGRPVTQDGLVKARAALAASVERRETNRGERAALLAELRSSTAA